MVKDKHVDPQVFDLFQTAGVYKDYAATHLAPSQLDDVPPPPAAQPQAGV